MGTPQVEHALWLVREALASGYDLPTTAYNHLLQVGGCWECGLRQVPGVWPGAGCWECGLGRCCGCSGQAVKSSVGHRCGPQSVPCKLDTERLHSCRPAPKLLMPPTHSRRPGSAPLSQLLAGRGEWERALAVHRAMNLAAARPDSTTAGLLVAACVHGGNQQLASQLAAVRGGGGGGRCNTLAGLYTAFAVIERAGVG